MEEDIEKLADKNRSLLYKSIIENKRKILDNSPFHKKSESTPFKRTAESDDNGGNNLLIQTSLSPHQIALLRSEGRDQKTHYSTHEET